MKPLKVIRKLTLVFLGALFFAGNLMAQQRLDSIVTYYYPAGQDSVNGVKIAEEYNDPGQLTSHSIYFWDASARRWDGGSFPCEECFPNPGRYEYGYDSRGNLISSRAFEWWGTTTGWLERVKATSSYDDNNHKLTSDIQLWDVTEKAWVNDMGWEYVFDESGHLLSSILNRWYPERQSWGPFEKMDYAWEASGKKSLEIRQNWVDSIQDWGNRTKTEWQFDSLGRNTGIAYYTWGLVNNQYDWKTSGLHKIEYVRDSMGNCILTTDLIWVSETRWNETWQEERRYDAEGRTILLVIRKGSVTLSEYLRTEWEYSGDGKLIQETVTGKQDRRPGHAIPEKRRVIRSLDPDGNIACAEWHYWDGESQSYLFESKDYYFYSTGASGLTATRMDALRIFPNPTDGNVYLSGLTGPAEIKVYSVQGQLLRLMLQVTDQFNIGDLPAGTYILSLSSGTHPPVRTLFIRK